MKKILLIIPLFTILFLTSGCDKMMNTPTKRVEEFLGKYQVLDSSVLTNLDEVVDDSTYSEDLKKDYKDLMHKQYQNLSYKIKNEDVDGDRARVIVEIEVFDYEDAIDDADDYIKEHPEEFEGENGLSSKEKQDEYRLKAMKATTDKANYTIDFNLVKDDKKWVLEQISDIDLQKIHGLYED